MKFRTIKASIALLIMACLLISLVTVSNANPATLGHTPTGLSFEEMERQIDEIMSEYIGTSIPGAAIAVVYEGEIVFSRGYGYADIENRIPVDPATTVFELASISKPFVWVATMQLVEQGLIDLDAEITNYLPDTFHFEKPFTMRDIMNHSSGFAESLWGAFPPDLEQLPTLEEVLLSTQPTQIFTPGVVSAYSNWGSALAGLVVANISGQDFVEFERENILHPANMHNTLNLPDWFGNYSYLANRARGYASGGYSEFSETISRYVLTYPSGAINGTAEDLAAFIMALTPPAGESGPLFEDAETLRTMFSSSSLDPNRPGMNHGFFPYSGVLPASGHGGNLDTVSTDLAIVPEARFGYALLTNVSGEMELLPAIAELLLGNIPTEALPTATDLPSTQTVEGRFISARRMEGDFLEFGAYAGLTGMPMGRVTALDERTILLSLGFIGSAVYIQTEPYVFRVYDSTDGLLLEQFLPELRFRVEDGVAVQVLVPGTDFTSLPPGRTMPILIISLGIAIVGVVFLLLFPIVLLISYIVNRKKGITRTRFDRFSTGLILSGTMLVSNIVVLFIRMISDPFRMAAEIAPHIWINYVLAGLAVLLVAGSLWSWGTAEGRTKRKILFVSTTIIMILFIFTLEYWNFFVLL